MKKSMTTSDVVLAVTLDKNLESQGDFCYASDKYKVEIILGSGRWCKEVRISFLKDQRPMLILDNIFDVKYIFQTKRYDNFVSSFKVKK